MSDALRWARVRALFDEAADLDGEARAAFLRSACEGDPALRAEVDALLAADAEASRFLDPAPGRGGAGAADAGHTAPGWVGRSFGDYRVVGELGRGGMGVVLLAERADGLYDRQVALKVVPATLVQSHLAERFRAEVRILAALDHPNVARLLDAGETPEGLAYLVMEYVDGPAIDRFADERRLDLPARLRLVRQVLDGVEYAHRRGVVHRDLKPSNILVNREGTPKLVDFGIAKLLDPEPGAAPAVTRTAQRMLTPEYASPEQVRGEPVDGRSDVYSLGVVLYRLLTGHPPYALPDTRPGAAERIICEERPGRPSDAAARTVPLAGAPPRSAPDADTLAGLRSSTGERLRRTLRGDLDTLVLRALEKEPELRYPTAAALAEDIDRFLDGRPIRGRRSRPFQRLGWFLRRRRVPVAAGASLVAALGVVAWQAREAGTQRRTAEANSAELTGLVGSVLATLNTDLAGEDLGPTATRVTAVEAAVAALDTLATRAPGSPGPELLEALAQAYHQVALLQGHPSSANVGRTDDARVSFEKAIEYWNRLAVAEGGPPRIRVELAGTEVLLSDIDRVQGRNEAAALLLDRAAARIDSVRAESRGEPAVRTLSTEAMVVERRAQLSEARGDFATTASYVRRLSELARLSAERSPPGPERLGTLEEVVLALQYESYIHSRAGDLETAIRTQRDAARLADSIADLPAATQRMQGIRANAWSQLGWRYNDADRPGEAAVAFDRAVALARTMFAADARNQAAVGSLASHLAGRGQAYIRAERWDEALADHREVLDLFAPLLPTLPSVGYFTAQSWRQMGEALTRLGRFTEADSAYAAALAGSERLLGADSAAAALKVLALAHYSRSLSLHLRVDAAGDPSYCAPALDSERRALRLWGGLRDQGQVFDGEQIIWDDFTSMFPPGVCPPG